MLIYEAANISFYNYYIQFFLTKKQLNHLKQNKRTKKISLKIILTFNPFL